MKSVNFLKNLADETRLRILLLILREEELCVCELTQALNLSQPKISRHIAQLRKESILQDRREGKWVFYCLSPQMDIWQKSLLNEISNAEAETTKADMKRLVVMGNRPQRQARCCN